MMNLIDYYEVKDTEEVQDFMQYIVTYTLRDIMIDEIIEVFESMVEAEEWLVNNYDMPRMEYIDSLTDWLLDRDMELIID